MKVLLIKTSSLGDILHTLPALTDAAHYMPEISFDWVVEQSFAEIPSWHRQVNRVIPIAWRNWRKNIFKSSHQNEIKQFYQKLRSESYDRIIDAQALVKSALIARMSRGVRYGLDFRSARESLATLFYQKRVTVEFKQHAILRMRQLFALCLDYPVPACEPDYGLNDYFSASTDHLSHQILFFHGTTRQDKEWPEPYWRRLAHYCVESGMTVLLPWGNETEKKRAERIAEKSAAIKVLPKSNLTDLARVLLAVRCVVAVDTGLGHLAAALNVPTVSLYGPTDPEMIGACGKNQYHLRAQTGVKADDSKSMQDLIPEVVWEKLCTQLQD